MLGQVMHAKRAGLSCSADLPKEAKSILIKVAARIRDRNKRSEHPSI